MKWNVSSLESLVQCLRSNLDMRSSLCPHIRQSLCCLLEAWVGTLDADWKAALTLQTPWAYKKHTQLFVIVVVALVPKFSTKKWNSGRKYKTLRKCVVHYPCMKADWLQVTPAQRTGPPLWIQLLRAQGKWGQRHGYGPTNQMAPWVETKINVKSCVGIWKKKNQ